MILKLIYRVGEFRNTTIKITKRFRHKLNKTTVTQTGKEAADVMEYINNTPEYQSIRENIPKHLLRKYKTPENMYLINRNTAKTIANTLKNNLSIDCPVVEVNPGFGFLTQELLKCHINHLYLYETSNHFSEHLNLLQQQYPEQITFKVADFFGMWKLAFQDKMDQGQRVKDLLGVLATDDSERMVNIVGSMPGLTFVKHIINNIIFHNTANQLGRPNLFITMPRHHYEFLADKEIQLSKHNSTAALFQLLFDYKILNRVPKVHFLPWTYTPNIKRATVIDEFSLYLVKITQKSQIPCHPDYLPMLWYFFKPHMLSKSTKVIPFLEQWIPGCGLWLISGQDPPDTNKTLAPSESDAQLPHMTIFTEFGDLTLNQKVTVFKKFISWPEFEQCQFRVTVENNLPKSVSAVDQDDKDSIGTHIDEDLDQTEMEQET